MKQSLGIGGHQLPVSNTAEWLTPPWLIPLLGTFDLDPCSPIKRPWNTAHEHYTIEDDGLSKDWAGKRIWLNPPYGKNRGMGRWMDAMRKNNNGVGLIFARTDTEDFHRYIFPHVDSILFIEGRLTFYTVAGTKAKANGGAPSVLLGYGEDNTQAIAESPIKGRLWRPNSVPVVVVGISPSWKCVVTLALSRLNGEAAVDQVYTMVERIAPDKIQKNPNYKEKIRQKLQIHFERVKKGYYRVK